MKRRFFSHVPMVLAMAVAPAFAAGHGGQAGPGSLPCGPLESTLEINDLAMGVVDNGMFAFHFYNGSTNLEYPRGSGNLVAFAGGFWVSGRVAGETRMVISEFGSEWAPGPLAPSRSLPWNYGVFRSTRGDTAGRAAWNAVAVPFGAPAAPPGDQTTWAVCNDLDDACYYARGDRLTPRIGLEARFTSYAFDRPGALRRAAFVHLQLIHGGFAPLDSAAIGVFFDPRISPPALRAAYDASRDMGYSFPANDPASGEAIAVGIVWLGGPRSSPAGARMRPTSYVVYPNGSDPGLPRDFDQVLRGLEPWGAAMFDSSLMQPTNYFSSGDPVAGTGWNATVPPHPHTVLAAQPFTFARGDTQDIDIAVVVGHGPDRNSAILDLRAAADEARAAFDAGFADLPGPDPYPAPGRLLAYPNPSPAGARVAFRVDGLVERVEAIVYDAGGRRVRRLLDASFNRGRHVIEWDGADDDGRRVGAGIYFVRVTVGGRAHTARVVRLSGD